MKNVRTHIDMGATCNFRQHYGSAIASHTSALLNLASIVEELARRR